MTDKVQEIMALPPLPKPAVDDHPSTSWHSFTAEQMREYARAAIEASLRVVAPPVPEPTASEREREAFQEGYAAAQADAQVCELPPPGWRCTRAAGHDGPCAAIESPEDVALVAKGMERLREATHTQPASEPVALSGLIGLTDASGTQMTLREGLDAAIQSARSSGRLRTVLTSALDALLATPQPAAKPAQGAVKEAALNERGSFEESPITAQTGVGEQLAQDAEKLLEAMSLEGQALTVEELEAAILKRCDAVEKLHIAVGAFRATAAQAEPVARDGWKLIPDSAAPMNAARASFFMERFLKEEKLLGPNEQAALHFVIDLLAASPAQP